MLPHFKPRRCARGFASIDKDSTLMQTVSLFNDSTGPYYLAVRDFFINIGTQSAVYTDLVAGAHGTLFGRGAPIVPGEPTPPGALYTELVAAAPTPDYEVGTGVTNLVPWVHNFPYTILQPGWSLRFTANTANAQGLELSIFWQYCRAEEIDGSFADLALKLAGG